MYSLRLSPFLKFERTLFQLTGCGEQVGEGKMVEKSGKEQAGEKTYKLSWHTIVMFPESSYLLNTCEKVFTLHSNKPSPPQVSVPYPYQPSNEWSWNVVLHYSNVCEEFHRNNGK